jgi:hypothetical protein
MRLRGHRRSLVVWSQFVTPADKYGPQRLTRLRRTGPIRSNVRVGALITVMGLMRIARGVRNHWRPLLAGVLITAGVMLRSGTWGVLLLAGLWFLLYAFLMPARTDGDRKQRCQLRRELARYSTVAQRRDLEATLDRYPDGVTSELRDILASQTLAPAATGLWVPGSNGGAVRRRRVGY